MSSIFNHIKWHTIDDFFNELAHELSEHTVSKIELKPLPEQITKLAHSKGKSQEKLILRFLLNDKWLQIVADSKGITLGNLSDNTWDYFTNKVKDIKLNDFHLEETFKLISPINREEIIQDITKQVLENYSKLKNKFNN